MWSIITKFHTDIHTGLVYNHTGYDVTSYFRLEVKETNNGFIMTPPFARGPFFKNVFILIVCLPDAKLTAVFCPNIGS